MKELAINGGKPVRKQIIRYGHQWIDEEDINAAKEVLKGDFITCGPKVKELERRLEEYTSAKHAVVLANGTAALHCSCIAIGLKEGDELITTPMTFAASANCALYCGARPVFADIDSETYNIDPQCIADKITPQTKAVVAVDFAGQPVKLNEIRKLCKENNLTLIEDAAHSIGSRYNGQMVGSLADITTFSFHPVKTITCGEGGAIITDDYELYKKLMNARNHGNVSFGEPFEEPWRYDVTSLGYNYRLTDFQSAILLNQLDRIDSFIERRKEIVEIYNHEFEDMPELILQKEIPEADSCRHLYIIQLVLERLRCTRLEFFKALSAEGVVPQVHYIPVYWFTLYQKLGYQKGLCPRAENLYDRIMSIPLYPKMTDQDVRDTVAAVKKVVDYYKK